MKFTPKYHANQEFQTGECTWEVIEAIEDVTSKNDATFIVDIKLTDFKGSTWTYKEWLPITALWKLENLLTSAGKVDLYNTGEVNASDLLKLRGKGISEEESYIKKNGNTGVKYKIKEFVIQDKFNNTNNIEEDPFIKALNDDIEF